MKTLANIDILEPAFIANPYPTFKLLRTESPVHPITLRDGSRAWLITRYDDAVLVMQDRRFVKDLRQILTPEEVAKMPYQQELLSLLSNTMLDFDPPNHTRLRVLVQKAFSPRMIEQLDSRIQEIADGLLDTVEHRDKMDLIEDYAHQLPIVVIAEMLGVPVEDRDKFRYWSNEVIADDMSQENQQHLIEVTREFTDYFKEMFAQRRINPKDDLISALVQAEDTGDKLSEKELYSMVLLLLVAGHETTVNLITNGMLALFQHPEQLALLKQYPELIDSAVEEFLRYDGSVEYATFRYASEDVELRGTRIPRGEQVMVVLASANRDERKFSNPDKLDIQRTENRHLAFGHGIHYCLGASLARMEGKIAINTLLRRIPNIDLNIFPSELQWRPSLVARGVMSLPVKFNR